MIDISIRLRRAILLNDIALVQRIVKSNPKSLKNADIEDRSNTSLHLAAKEGFVEIVEYLIYAGHEDKGISKNADWETPLMVAAEFKQVDVALLLIEKCSRCVPWTNKSGMDALMLSCRSGTTTLLVPLLTAVPIPCSATSHDIHGTTALHYASASGELKAMRILLEHGANAFAKNMYNWTPIAYSSTKEAELYFKSLIKEFEIRRVERERGEREREREREVGGETVTLPPRGDSITGMKGMRGTGVRLVTSDDMEIMGPPSMAARNEWSPVEARRAMTPTASKSSDSWAGFGKAGGRVRASSGD
ncbi:ankyrin [Aulographum hederae CBS 113979]|uniref:Ankyrin n=1 Tax=Aulographum hederae CBS 113979 TaxID=1176131 RepID=A0A6G1GYE0_9PEZI|nr:ankyrin [Aulographum hederae CBS 113979]